MRVAYLACRETHPDIQTRREDAWEHDTMMAMLTPAFADAGMGLSDPIWDDPDVQWASYDAAVIGTTWDYASRTSEFLDTVERIDRATMLLNPAHIIRWNHDKRYLAELDALGIPSIPTVWLDTPSAAAIATAFRQLESDDLVLKQVVGAGAIGQVRLSPADPVPALSLPMLAQAFLPSIQTEGELSFVFVDGQFSHAVRKTPNGADYRIQSLYGGVEQTFLPDRSDLEAAERVLAVLPLTPLYARVDMVRHDGVLLLMELELVEPYLYPDQGPALGTRLAAAVRKRLELRTATPTARPPT